MGDTQKLREPEQQDILDFANTVRVGFLGTIDAGQPRVRGVLLWYADDSGFYFHTSKTKELHIQLKKTPLAEVAFFQPDPPPSGTMLRVAGRVEFLEGMELKTRLLLDRPWLNSYSKRLQENLPKGSGGSGGVTGKALDPCDPDDFLSIFRIVNTECRIWNHETNTRENEAKIISIA